MNDGRRDDVIEKRISNCKAEDTRGLAVVKRDLYWKKTVSVYSPSMFSSAL